MQKVNMLNTQEYLKIFRQPNLIIIFYTAEDFTQLNFQDNVLTVH